MNVHVVAAKDFRDAVRSKMLWSLTGLLVVLIGVVYIGSWLWGDDTDPTFLAEALALPLQVIVPLLALIAGFMSIVGERRSGSIKLLLGLPPNRFDMVAGKLLGRLGVVSVAILVGGLVAAILSGVFFGEVPLQTLASTIGVTLLLGGAFVGIAVGVSAAVATRGKAMASVIGAYILFVGFWNVIGGGLYRMIEGEFPPNPMFGDAHLQPWVLFFQRLNPIEAYATVASALVDEQIFPLTLQFPNTVPTIPQDRFEESIAGEVPFYLNEWLAVVVLLGWIVLPVVIGYIRFERSDLS